jgi:hypothetical protein
MTDAPIEKRRLYGRRLGRPLKQERMDVLETLLSNLAIPEGERIDPVRMFGTAL